MSNQFQISNFKFLDKALQFLLCVFLFLLPWQTIWIFREVFVDGVKMEWWTEGFYATEALLWVVILMFIKWYWREKKLRNLEIKKFSFSKDRIFVLAVLSLISYLLLSLIWSVDKSLALQQSLRVMEAFLLFFIILLGPLKKEEAIKWLVLGSILPCVLGIWQFLAQSTFASTWLGLALHPAWQGGTSVVASETIGRWLRAYGTFAHPNTFGGYIVIVLLLLMFYLKNVKIEDLRLKILIVTSYLLLITSLFFTFSRSAWVASVVGFSVIQFLSLRNRKNIFYLLSPIFLVIILSALFFHLVQTRFTGNSISESHSISDRVSGYSDAWKLFKQNPLLGVGVGNYTVAVWHADKWRPAWQIQPAHNAFVLFAVEGGLVGVGLFVFVLCLFFRYQLSDNKCQKCYLLFVICYLSLAFFDHYLYSSYVGLMLSALFFGLISRRNGENTVSPQLVHRDSFDTQSTACHNTPTRLR